MTNDMTPELTLEPTATATELPNLTFTSAPSFSAGITYKRD